MMEAQTRLISDEARFNAKLKVAQKSGGSGVNMDQIAEMKKDIQDNLDRFEEEFIDFINQNYQNFTENDVIGLFSNLRQSLTSAVGKVKATSDRKPFSQIHMN